MFRHVFVRYEATVEVNRESIAYATGLTKKEARQKAAMEALELLETVHEVSPLTHRGQVTPCNLTVVAQATILYNEFKNIYF